MTIPHPHRYFLVLLLLYDAIQACATAKVSNELYERMEIVVDFFVLHRR